MSRFVKAGVILLCAGIIWLFYTQFSESSLDSENLAHSISASTSDPKILAPKISDPKAYIPKVLTMAVSENIGALNPQGYQGNAMFAQNSVYEGLLSVNKYGALVPSLATSWEISDGGKVYDFTLREGVKFSNGEDFNAAAVVLNIQSILKNRARHSWSGLALALEGAEELSPYKVRLRLKNPYTPTLHKLAAVRPFRFLAPSAFPKDLDLIKHNPTPIGTGAYMLVDSKLGISDTLKKNPYFRDFSNIYFDEIRLKVIFDPNAKLAALKSNQIDMIYGYDQIPLEIFKALKNELELHHKAGSITTALSLPLFTTSLVINSSSPKLTLSSGEKSRALRLWLGQCINKERLIQAVYEGIQTSAKSIFVSQATQGASVSESSSLDSEISESKPASPIPQALDSETLNPSDQAIMRNLSSKGLELLFMGDNPAHKMMAEIIQAQMKACGVNVSLRASEPSIYKQRTLKGDFDLAFHESWGAPYEPLSELHSMLIPSHIDYAAQSGLEEKPLLDSKIRQLMGKEVSKELSESSLDEVLDMLQASGVYVPLTYARNKAIYKSHIKGVDMGVVGYEVPFWEFYSDE